MDTLVRINYTKRFSPYENDEKWMDLNNQYAQYDLKFEISEHGDLSIVTNLINVFREGNYSNIIIENINRQAQGLGQPLFLMELRSRNCGSTYVIQGSDIIDIYYDPELSCEDIGKYFLDRDCHNACIMMNFERYNFEILREERGHVELRDRIMSLFKCALYDNNRVAVIETKGDNFVKEKIKKICRLYMCEIDVSKIAYIKVNSLGTLIRCTFRQDEHSSVSVEII